MNTTEPTGITGMSFQFLNDIENEDNSVNVGQSSFNLENFLAEQKKQTFDIEKFLQKADEGEAPEELNDDNKFETIWADINNLGEQEPDIELNNDDINIEALLNYAEKTKEIDGNL